MIDGSVSSQRIVEQRQPASFEAAGSKNAVQRALRVFLVFFPLYLCTWAGHYTSGDGARKIIWAKVM